MFVPKDNTTHPIGAQVQDDKNRYNGINSMYRRNEKPEESLLVGPGLNKGYNADPSDGFHSEYRPDYKSIDQLQVNPKTYEGRVVSGFKEHNVVYLKRWNIDYQIDIMKIILIDILKQQVHI